MSVVLSYIGSKNNELLRTDEFDCFQMMSLE